MPSPSVRMAPVSLANEAAWRGLRLGLGTLQAVMIAPSWLFLAALAAMLLRHPDVPFYEIDRVAFVWLALSVVGRALVAHKPLLAVERVTWPMLGLTFLAVVSVIRQPFDNQTWCLLAAKFIVPFALFHLAGVVFRDERRLRQFELFALIVLAYLCFTSIAFLVSAKSLIFPRFILDESLGYHADRARGPLLSFAASVGFLIFRSHNRRLRLICVVVAIVGALGLLIAMSFDDQRRALAERLQESGPLEFRKAVYTGGWEMFLEKPLTGWGVNQMPTELARHVSGYKEKELYPHNTYLEILVEHGIFGLGLYVWLMWEIYRLGRGPVPRAERDGLLNQQFHAMWPVLLGIYWVNANLVVMNYQFVNGLLFTMAGMLAAQQRRAAGASEEPRRPRGAFRVSAA
jgi:hypothetical protein